MKVKEVTHSIRNTVFGVLIALFVALLADVFGRFVQLPFFTVAIVFGLLGLALIVLTIRIRESRTRKLFFILTGASAAGIPLCAILHNVVYGLFIALFGKDFWGGGDEAVFFILALFVCPALFLVGVGGTLVTGILSRSAKHPDLA